MAKKAAKTTSAADDRLTLAVQVADLYATPAGRAVIEAIKDRGLFQKTINPREGKNVETAFLLGRQDVANWLEELRREGESTIKGSGG